MHRRKYLLTHLIKYLKDGGGVLSDLDRISAEIEKNTPPFGEGNETEGEGEDKEKEAKQEASAEGSSSAAAAAAAAADVAVVSAGAEGDAVTTVAAADANVPEAPPEPAGPRPEDLELIEKLEDSLYQVQQELAETKALVDKTLADKDFIANQLEGLIKEKRTDIVKVTGTELGFLIVSFRLFVLYNSCSECTHVVFQFIGINSGSIISFFPSACVAI
jgi:hypothetical protein